jgi:hypothetical protein
VTGESKFSVAPPVSRAACSGPPGPPPAAALAGRGAWDKGHEALPIDYIRVVGSGGMADRSVAVVKKIQI